METKESLLTSSRYTEQWSACLWDYVSGSALHFYKGGGVLAPKSLNLIASDYLLSVNEDKPKIQVWPLNSQEPQKKSGTILPDKATTVTVCPRSNYLAAAVGIKLYLWHISSGKLLSIQKKNFQPITCVKFSSDSVYLIVAGQDGMLIVYETVSLVSFHNNNLSQSDIGQVEPIYTKHDHSMPITDVYVGNFGCKSRMVSVSGDHTCKLYCLASGQLLLSLVFNENLMTVMFDGPCWNLFVGMDSGKIQQFHLKKPPRPLNFHVNDDCVFQGHLKAVTCLDINITNSSLVSGSKDNFVLIWEICSRQILRRIEHKAEITNVKFIMNYENFFVPNIKMKSVIRNLEKDYNQSELFLDSRIQIDDLQFSEDEEDFKQAVTDINVEAENMQLRSINKHLYKTAVQISQKYNNFLCQ